MMSKNFDEMLRKKNMTIDGMKILPVDDENHFVLDVLHRISNHHHLLLFDQVVLLEKENKFRIISAIENSLVEHKYIHHLHEDEFCLFCCLKEDLPSSGLFFDRSPIIARRRF